jgi:hypothetical protein
MAPSPHGKTPPILNLDTLTTRAIVKIAGTSYEVRNLEELPILGYRRLEHQRARLTDLMVKADAAETVEAAEAHEISQLLDRMCRQILDAPDAVLAALTDLERFAVLDFFYELRAMRTPTPVGAIETSATKIGALMPPGSPDPAAAT